MLRSPAFQALALGLLELGCGGGDDDSHANAPSGLAGMYQTMTTTTSSPCDATAAPDDNDPMYFQIKDEQDFGAAYIAVYPCAGSDPSSCEEFADIDYATAASGGTFASEELSLSSDGSPAPSSCSGEYSTAVIARTTDGVTISTTARTGTLTGADLCKVNQQFSSQQEAAIKALPCTSQRTADAQRL
jgi:hypothetical protein